MKEATGAARVVAFDHIVRNAGMSDKGNTIKIPAKRVHNDYTAWSSPQRVRDLMGDEAEELLKNRYAIINLWRPIRGPVLEIAADLVRRAEPVRGKPDRQRPQIPGPHRRDLFGHLQSKAALLLLSEDAVGRGGADPLLRTRRPRAPRGFPPTPASTTRPRHPTRRRARASKCAPWCSTRRGPDPAQIANPHASPFPTNGERATRYARTIINNVQRRT